MIWNIILISGLLILTLNNTSKGWFDQIQESNRNKCEKFQVNQYQDCLDDLYLESYDSYRRTLDQGL